MPESYQFGVPHQFVDPQETFDNLLQALHNKPGFRILNFSNFFDLCAYLLIDESEIVRMICNSAGAYCPTVDNFLAQLYQVEEKGLGKVIGFLYKELGIELRWYYPDHTLKDFESRFQDGILPIILRQFVFATHPVPSSAGASFLRREYYHPLLQRFPELVVTFEVLPGDRTFLHSDSIRWNKSQEPPRRRIKSRRY